MTLTKRQREVAELVAQRFGDEDIAAELHCSTHTVHAHVAAIAKRVRDAHPEAPELLKGRKLVRWFQRMVHVSQTV